MITEQHIKTAAKLYQMRDTAKRFFKEEWPDKMREWRSVIEAVMRREKIDELEAAMKICKDANHGFTTIIVMATVCEMIEPSKD